MVLELKVSSIHCWGKPFHRVENTRTQKPFGSSLPMNLGHSIFLLSTSYFCFLFFYFLFLFFSLTLKECRGYCFLLSISHLTPNWRPLCLFHSIAGSPDLRSPDLPSTEATIKKTWGTSSLLVGATL